ncbi:sodium/proline symporter [Haladaptatus caseinilyticus]|uniref:sodium/proline symporter n=1 Tax=Haladaptatus caseinilyticus TaxID=2993314 RepID=UPI00224AB6EC|nr:sodium/proline symporter [Haladaptatus caseinilyticus]
MPDGAGLAGSAGIWVLGTFGAYLLILIGIGLWASKMMDTVGDYVIGGRQIGPVVTGFSERASEMSGWLTLGVPANAYGTGIMAFLNGLGMIPADLLAWAGLAKRLRKYTEIVKSVTLPTFFATRLQDDTGMVKGVSAIVLMLFEGGYVGAQIVAAGTLLQILTGVEPWVGIVVGGVIVVGYTMLGGYFAVAWSDYFQGAIILVAFIILPIIAFTNFGLPFNDLASVGGGSFTSITAGATGWAAVFGIISYAAIGLGVPGNPHIMVRFMGIDRVKNVRLAAMVAQLFMFVAYIGAALVGLYAILAFGQGDLAQADNAMPRLTLSLLPGPIAGIVLAAALAAMMSSADSQLLVATSAIVEDVYHGFMNKQATEQQLVRYSRYVTLGLGGASIAFAYLAKSTPIYTLVLDYAWGGLGAAIGPTLIAALWWKRVTAKGSVASMVVGATTMVVWTQLGSVLDALGIMPAQEASPFLYNLVGVYGLFPAFILSVITLVSVSLVTKPPSGVEDHFDVFDKPLSQVTSQPGSGTPSYVTDGGRDVSPKAITEADNIRAHVVESGYWNDE